MTDARNPSGEVAQLACIATFPVDLPGVGGVRIAPAPWGVDASTERGGRRMRRPMEGSRVLGESMSKALRYNPYVRIFDPSSHPPQDTAPHPTDPRR
jgi:hypothetical protein